LDDAVAAHRRAVRVERLVAALRAAAVSRAVVGDGQEETGRHAGVGRDQHVARAGHPVGAALGTGARRARRDGDVARLAVGRLDDTVAAGARAVGIVRRRAAVGTAAVARAVAHVDALELAVRRAVGGLADEHALEARRRRGRAGRGTGLVAL